MTIPAAALINPQFIAPRLLQQLNKWIWVLFFGKIDDIENSVTPVEQCDTTHRKPKPEQAAWSAASTDTQPPLLPPLLAASASAAPTNSAYFILKI
ncbi:hypothetical protein M422DRAFT_265142 [Sphaerobolus stellatus SS14]|uniref:Unplaced genomic scaffold SPHSTscaffold_144, whole genome shotgun sequence n=1 Tax=Sphaerobolus stellatus (strain SS14) TaxID=990650 RepID=A0A0C9V661_SPHS4|nr:hypothetical protein M422DRAFT_265142 [Sphaerobolus stellatus SS14]